MRELNQYELNPPKINIRWSFLTQKDEGNKDIKLYWLHRFLSNKNMGNITIPEHDRFMSNLYYDEFFVLAECYDVEPDIDLMLIEICNGGDHLHKLADWIFKHSPLMRSHKDLVVHSKKFRDQHLAEQKRIKEQIDQIHEDQESGRGSRGGEKEKDFVTPYL